MKLFQLVMAMGIAGLVTTADWGNDTQAKYIVGACLVLVGYCVGRIHEIDKLSKEQQ